MKTNNNNININGQNICATAELWKNVLSAAKRASELSSNLCLIHGSTKHTYTELKDMMRAAKKLKTAADTVSHNLDIFAGRFQALEMINDASKSLLVIAEKDDTEAAENTPEKEENKECSDTSDVKAVPPMFIYNPEEVGDDTIEVITPQNWAREFIHVPSNIAEDNVACKRKKIGIILNELLSDVSSTIRQTAREYVCLPESRTEAGDFMFEDIHLSAQRHPDIPLGKICIMFKFRRVGRIVAMCSKTFWYDDEGLSEEYMNKKLGYIAGVLNHYFTINRTTWTKN